MKKIILLTIILFVIILCVHAEVVNTDKPLKGQWDFNLKKVWEFDRAGDNVLGGPGPLAVSQKGDIVVRDWKRKMFYLFSAEGKFVKSFAPKGEGPAEIRRIDEAELFCAGDKIIIADIGKINYYNGKAVHLRTVNYLNRKKMPHIFLDEHRYLYAPIFKSHMPDGKGEISLSNLKTAGETRLVKFSIDVPKKKSGGELVIFSLTPTMTMGYGNDRVYYGMNDSYRIHIADKDGKPLGAFSLKRSKEGVSVETKKKFLNQWGDPAELVNKWAKELPGELTYFNRIDVHNGLVYVFNSLFGETHERVAIDIFSGDGKYLYRAVLDAGKNMSFHLSHTKNIVIKDGFLYAVLESGEGELKIVKYGIALPK
ncbi:MAG: hypothetical protein GY765_39680 [bacterium]|nr:hypothetical protein [bacterium]